MLGCYFKLSTRGLDMRFGITPLALLLLAMTLSAQTQECPDLYKRYSSEHTFCRPPNKECKIEKSGISDEDKALIVKLHNDYRSRVATGNETNAGGMPSATNMLEMVWDDELAAVAQKLAETCNYGHDCNNCRKVKAFSVGQNIGKSMGHTKQPEAADWQSFIKGLYDEVTRFNKKFIKPFVPGPSDQKKQYGDFTQMVWAESWKIGCGWTVYKEGSSYSSYTVCNYGPSGNVVNQKIYDAGPSCSKCPNNTCCEESCKEHGIEANYPGLCKVIDTTTSPEGPGPHGKAYTFFCDFSDQPDCERSVEGKEWKVEKTAGGNWLSVIVKGGEKTKVTFKKEIPYNGSICLNLLIRTCSNVYAEDESGQGVTILDFGSGSSAVYNLDFSGYPKEERQNFIPNRYNLYGGGQYFQFSFEYTVPAGGAPQFVEIREVSVHDGACEPFPWYS